MNLVGIKPTILQGSENQINARIAAGRGLNAMMQNVLKAGYQRSELLLEPAHIDLPNNS
jgi:hypothetical protein